MKVLANDGISRSGVELLEKNGFDVELTKVAQEQLPKFINDNNITVLLVRSATQVRKDIIDECKGLKIIGRGGVGMDNIDVDYAKSKNIEVINTPAASSKSVAELVFSHLFGCVRFIHNSNRDMPLEGDTHFKDLKKSSAAGRELHGKTLGIIGFGRIGQEIELKYFDNQKLNFKLNSTKIDVLLKSSDFVTLHVPASDKYLIDKKEISLMKDGSGIVNLARGGVINEEELLKALDSNKLAFAAIDTFEDEPKPKIKILMNSKISLSPHIGAATLEAQDRIGIELADKIIKLLK